MYKTTKNNENTKRKKKEVIRIMEFNMCNS